MESKTDLTKTAKSLHKWYLTLSFQKRKEFREKTYSYCMTDVKNPRAKLWNWLQGKSAIPAIAKPKVYEAIVETDPTVDYAHQFNFNFNYSSKMENNIHRLLNERKWTQEKLAKDAGITRVTVNLIANSAVEPGGYTMMRIAAAFDLGVEEVFPPMQIKKSA